MALSRYWRDDPLGSNLIERDPFADFFSTGGGWLTPSVGGALSTGTSRGQPVVPSLNLDVKEKNNEFQVAIDAPGMKKEDFDVTFDNNVLRVACERKEEKEEEDARWHISERRWGSSSRSVRLPRTANGDGITAEYDSGVLKIHVPKTQESETRKTIRVS
ncbi:heat shock protein hsp20 [Nannochloropsis gaditana]|uniref:Heat shock protein hsp20 n=1 Tax=Nannochloropsis gaditana TaxID=72520 RepID=W7T683_9STRA|nr:heat shock protein hsp20 [Nannochloropsis gaditana]